MMIQREETIGDCRLILGDCLEVMPTLGRFDACVTDPPYGIGYQSTLTNIGAQKFEKLANDSGGLDISLLFGAGESLLIFGANCFPASLPHRGRWLCWDKRTIDGACDKMLGSPFELAWSNKVNGYDKIVRVLHGGVVNADGGKRVHPTQKPIAVMVAAIKWAAAGAETILDPFMGSGTTGVACVNLGRKFTGIELDPGYFDIACRRIEEAYKQPRLIEHPKPAPAVQEQIIFVEDGA
jgi:DNA modification methylase